ncbi:MAG TPA: sulfite exporter TauE/SafE family protein [Solirubrobacteraceae bacterium]|nr:sulfite exporter TauE/SafE family protein [Solirubrobacteraceae bacterium]
MIDAGNAALLAAAGLGAGAVNAVAGGGSLISFPALLAAGYPSITANVTNSIAVLPGYIGGSVAYRRELGGQAGRIRALALTSALGAAIGAALLLVSSASVFDAIVPWLILAACGLLAVQPRVAALARERRAHSPPMLHACVFAATVYGGYFGAGLGIMLLAILGVFVDDHLQRLNALKGVLSLLVAAVAAVGFALFGPVAWDATAIIGVTCLAGGALGVSVARRLSAAVLRGAVIAYGVVVALVLLVS